MKVDFDNLRKQLAYSYNKMYEDYIDLSETIKDSFDKEELENSMNDVRTYIGVLLACNSKGEDVFESIDIDLLPLDDDEDVE